MGEAVPHAGKFLPGQLRGGGGDLGGEVPDCLADLHQPCPHGVEDQTVAERILGRSALEVGVYRIAGDQDVPEAADGRSAHSVTASRSTFARTSGLSPSSGTRSTGAPTRVQPGEPDQADAPVQMHENVDVAVRPVLAAGGAAEQAQVADAVPRGDLADPLLAAPQDATAGRRRKSRTDALRGSSCSRRSAPVASTSRDSVLRGQVVELPDRPDDGDEAPFGSRIGACSASQATWPR